MSKPRRHLPVPDPLDSAGMDDAALLAALPNARPADATLLAQAVGHRRLQAAVPLLEALCRRYKGFGLRQVLRDQQAALRALAAIGGSAAAAALSRILADGVVNGPGRRDALDAAAHLGIRVPTRLLLDGMRHCDPTMRVAACHCARSGGEVVALLIDLLGDLNPPVSEAAACALGRLGRSEARPALLRLLLTAPSPAIIAAIVPLAGADEAVLLARVARAQPGLRDTVLQALDAIGQPNAAAIAARLRRDAPDFTRP